MTKQPQKTPALKPVMVAPGSGPVAKATDAAEAKAKAARFAKGPFPGNHVIRKLVSGNPKRPTGKSYLRFALLADGQTVDEYVKAVTTATDPRANAKKGDAMQDIGWNIAHSFIKLEAPETK